MAHHALVQLLLALPFIIALILYIFASVISSHRYRRWPIYRTVCWTVGVVCAVTVVASPIADHAQIDFTAHMFGHLLLGMLAPLLMVLGAPMTLLLRTLNTSLARHVTCVLRSWPARMFTHPILATFLNIGGLWVLYTTELFSYIHMSILLYVIVHFHVFLAGYMFTISMIYVDPIPHRFSFLYRAIVLMIALAGHSVLAKYIYAHPPAGVQVEQVELGAMLMYYGGDAIDVVLIFILCRQWFHATRPQCVNPNNHQLN